VSVLLRITDLEVHYGLFQALFGVSFMLEEGEAVCLLGSNGAGKTTTLRTTAGALRASRGRIEFLGRRVENRPSHELAALGMIHVPEGRELFPSLTVKENLRLGALTSEARNRAGATLEFVLDLFPALRVRASQLAGTLSGGQQQMVAIARGLMGLPRLLMLDEPSLGLAPVLVNAMFATIERINAAGTTLVVVEQHVHHALRVCRRGYVLEGGRIVQSGTTAELGQSDALRAAYLGM
jgi:branched-chain amino acid transport system ATP-binding protein